MALQEVRWPGSHEMKCGSYTILWSGPGIGAPRSAGVAIALDKDTFYLQIEQAIKKTHQSDLIVCPCGSGTSNDNTERLLNFYLGAGLRMGGSWFKRKNIHRYTWFSNDGIIVKEIDHVLVNTKWSALQNCRVYRSPEFDADHRLVITTMSLRLKRTGIGSAHTQHYDIKRLEDPAVQSQYAVEVSNRFAALTIDESSNWDKFKETLNDVAAQHLRFHRHKKKPSINEYKILNKQCKSNLKPDRQQWADNTAKDGKAALAAGEARDAFANFRRLAKVTLPISSPISGSTGNQISDKPRKLQRWRSYYTKLFNRPDAPVSEDLATAAQSAAEDSTINCNKPTTKEVLDCLRKLKNGKALGICITEKNDVVKT
ncbi:unnamed protein product, partial [Adineta ricciae]